MGVSSSSDIRKLSFEKRKPLIEQLDIALKNQDFNLLGEVFGPEYSYLLSCYRQLGTNDPAFHVVIRKQWQAALKILIADIQPEEVLAHVDNDGNNPLHLVVDDPLHNPVIISMFEAQQKLRPWRLQANKAGVTPSDILNSRVPKDFPLPHFWVPYAKLSTVSLLPGGRGGYSIIYRAELNGQTVVIKSLLKAAQGTHVIQREFHLLARLSHPNIIQLLGATVIPDSNHIALILPFSPLGDVVRWMAQNPAASLAVRLDLVQQIARGLHHMHLHSIFHNDIKPNNVLVFSASPDGPLVAKLIDFGISFDSVVSAKDTACIAEAHNHYGAPERRNTAGASRYQPSVASDMYSFGVTALEILPEWASAQKSGIHGQHLLFHRFLHDCTAQDPAERPSSFFPLLQSMTPTPEHFPEDYKPYWIPPEWIRTAEFIGEGGQSQVLKGYMAISIAEDLPQSPLPSIKSLSRLVPSLSSDLPRHPLAQRDASPSSPSSYPSSPSSPPSSPPSSAFPSPSPSSSSLSSSADSLSCSTDLPPLPSSSTSPPLSLPHPDEEPLLSPRSRAAKGSLILRSRRLQTHKEIAVALKIVHRTELHDRPLRREIAFLTKAKKKPHNVIPLSAVSQLDGSLCLITPFSETGSLHSWLAHLPLLPSPEEDARLAYIVSGIALGLHCLHTLPQPIIHNDVKPYNVLLFPPRRGCSDPSFFEPYLIDFGLSYLSVADSSEARTALASLAIPTGRDVVQQTSVHARGTPLYVAPERELDKAIVPSPQTDIYMFSVTAWHVFHRSAPKIDQLDIGFVTPEALDPTGRHFPEDMIAFINRGLSLEPTERPTSFEDFPFHPVHRSKLAKQNTK